MPKCDLCGQDAGFLRKRHKECERKHDEGISAIASLGKAAALSGTGFPEFAARAEEIASSSFIARDKLRLIYVAAWDNAVDASLEDNVLSPDEEHALIAYRDHFSLSQDELDTKSSYSRVVKAAVIRDLLEDKLPSRVTVEGSMPFNLQKAETILWFFNNVQYYEERTRTTYQGSYQGASVRVAKGLYYRVGGFRGNPVITSQLVHVATGQVGITQKHIYFAGGNKAFRVPFQKIAPSTHIPTALESREMRLQPGHKSLSQVMAGSPTTSSPTSLGWRRSNNSRGAVPGCFAPQPASRVSVRRDTSFGLAGRLPTEVLREARGR